MPRHRIDELLRIVNRSFDGSAHSLLTNLGSVTESEWDVLPEGAGRSIQRITLHVGMFKYIYANHGFRDASIGYGDPPANPPQERLATPETATAWLSEAHAYLIAAMDELPDDQELERPRKAHWGEMVPTLFLIDTMHEHDLYHSGEINKPRATLQGDDGTPPPPS